MGYTVSILSRHSCKSQSLSRYHWVKAQVTGPHLYSHAMLPSVARSLGFGPLSLSTWYWWQFDAPVSFIHRLNQKIDEKFSCLFSLLSRMREQACASKVFSLRADCGRVIVYPGLKQWERPRHNIFGVCTRLAGGVCMSTSANSSASKHLTVTKIVWKIVYVTFDYLISHFFKILSLEFMANLFRDFRASVSLKVFHYRLRGKWCQYDLEIN